jgi:signal transduction histidine kinase
MEDIPIDEVIDDVCESFRLRCARAGVEFVTDVAAGLPMVRGNRESLRSAFGNLLSNAYAHAGSGRWIRLEASAANGFVRVSVQDRGPGIPRREQRRIFDAFYRGNLAKNRQTPGAAWDSTSCRRSRGSTGARSAWRAAAVAAPSP